MSAYGTSTQAYLSINPAATTLYSPSNKIGNIQNVQVTRTLTNAANTDIATFDTLHVMKMMAREYSSSIRVSNAVDDATSNLSKSSSDKEVIRSLYWYVKRKIKFTEDETIMQSCLGITEDDLIATGGKDLLLAPDLLLSMKQPIGDCDDFSTLLASMLLNLSYPVWFVVIAADEKEPMKFSHVYVKAFLPDIQTPIYLDASHGSYPGWEYGKQFRKVEYAV